MPRRPKSQNKSLPKFLQPGVDQFAHWGRRMNEIFPDGPTSPPTHPNVGSSSQSETDSIQIIEYHLPDETPRDSIDEMLPTEPCTDTSQPSSPSSSYRSSRQRSKRATQNTSRSMTNDPASQPACKSRRRKSRRLRHETGYPADDTETSQLSPSNHSRLFNTSFAISSQWEPINESTDHDRSTSASFVQESLDPFTREAGLSIRDKMPASFPRSPQRTVFFEQSPILPPAEANGSSQTITPFPIPPSNLGSHPGSFPPVIGLFPSGDATRANPAVVQYPSFTISEPPISSPTDFGSLTYSTGSFTYMDPVHGSSSSLSPMAQAGFYNQNYDLTDGGILFSPYCSSTNDRLVPSQPVSSVNPQNYPGLLINNPVGTHSSYAGSNQRLSHVRSPSLHAISSSSQLTQMPQAYVPTFGVDADVQGTFLSPEMDYRILPRSYSQEQQYGLSQGEIYNRSQRLRHTSPRLSPAYARTGYHHPPNAVATSSASRLEQRSSSSGPWKDSDWSNRGRC